MAKKKKNLPHPAVLKAGEFIVPTIIALALISSIIMVYTVMKPAEDQPTSETDISQLTTEEIQELIDSSQEDSKSPSKTTEAQPTDVSVKVTILKEGSGSSAKTGDTLTVHYTGTLTDGSKFDSSYDHPGQEPFDVTLGAGQVIPGWEQGLLGMKVGEKRKLEIPYQLGYGEAGFGPIPPKADLVFEVELLEIK